MIEIIQIPVLSDNYVYIIIDSISNTTACVDPAISKPILNFLDNRKLNLDFILNTHHHNDHTGANLELKKVTNCKVVGSEEDCKRIPGIDIKLKKGDLFQIGNHIFEVLDVPGHTLGHICFYCKKEDILFSGDTLFSFGCGRIFEGGPEQMLSSLKQIRSLPDKTVVYCGHEYTHSNILFALSIEPENKLLIRKEKEISNLRSNGVPTVPFKLLIEKELNPFLRVNDKRFIKNLNYENLSETEIFKRLRVRKDAF